MRSPPTSAGQRRAVRSLFVSDVHLGCKHSQASHFLEFLQRHRPRYLYVVGDFFDGWKLRRRWRWSPVYDAILKQLLDLHRSGTRLCYAPGNHDAFLRPFLKHLTTLKIVDVRDHFIHSLADGRRFLVMHGDQFDKIEQSSQWISVAASIAYDALLTSNWFLNSLRGKRHSPYAFCSSIKRRVKFLVSHISAFEDQLVQRADDLACQGVVCGHIHAPRIVELGGVTYCNTGDWVENCSALVEYDDGSLELVRADGRVIERRGPGHVMVPQLNMLEPEWSPDERRKQRVSFAGGLAEFVFSEDEADGSEGESYSTAEPARLVA